MNKSVTPEEIEITAEMIESQIIDDPSVPLPTPLKLRQKSTRRMIDGVIIEEFS